MYLPTQKVFLKEKYSGRNLLIWVEIRSHWNSIKEALIQLNKALRNARYLRDIIKDKAGSVKDRKETMINLFQKVIKFENEITYC